MMPEIYVLIKRDKKQGELIPFVAEPDLMTTDRRKTYLRTLNRIKRLQLTLDIPNQEFADILCVTEENLDSALNGGVELPFDALANITDIFNLCPDTFVFKNVDYVALAEHYRGNSDYIPEKYSVAAFSHRRTGYNILREVEKTYGPIIVDRILRALQVTKYGLLNVDANINIRFGMDVFKQLSRFIKVDENVFFKFGTSSVIANKATSLGNELSLLANPSEVYERMIEELVSFYEKNCSYRLLNLGDTTCRVESKQNEDVASALKVRRLGNPSVCAYKSGILAATPAYIGLPSGSVKEAKCIHRGDPSCVFEINYDRALFDSKLRKGQISSALPARFMN